MQINFASSRLATAYRLPSHYQALRLRNLITNQCKLVEGKILIEKKHSFIQSKIKKFCLKNLS